MDSARRVVIALFDEVELLDVTGPAEVFSAASRLLAASGGTPGGAAGGYTVELAAARPGPVVTSSGVQLVATATFDDTVDGVHTVIVPGGLRLVAGAPDAGAEPEPVVDPDAVAWVRRGAAVWPRVASVCTGAYLLAAAGVLDGHRAATHWYAADDLAARFPTVQVDPDPIFIRSGRVWSCAGVSAGMDLALAMVADDHGDRLARSVARWLVMYLRRPGGQSQFSVALSTPAVRHDRIRQVQRWIGEHPEADLSVPALARRAHLSPRHFARLFTEQTRTTPAAYVEASRIEAARRLLEAGDDPLEVVASRCGFGSVESLYRGFRRRGGTTPAAYRDRFRTPHPS